MRANDGLRLFGVIQALDVAEVGNIESGDVVSKGKRKVGPFAIVGDVGVDGDGVLSLLTKVVEELGNTLLALGVLAEGVDDPDLARVDGAD